MYTYICSRCDQSDGGPCTLKSDGNMRPRFCPFMGHALKTWEATDIHISALSLTEDQYREISRDIYRLGGMIDLASFPAAIHAHLPNTPAVHQWVGETPGICVTEGGRV